MKGNTKINSMQSPLVSLYSIIWTFTLYKFLNHNRSVYSTRWENILGWKCASKKSMLKHQINQKETPEEAKARKGLLNQKYPNSSIINSFAFEHHETNRKQQSAYRKSILN